MIRVTLNFIRNLLSVCATFWLVTL